MKYNLNTAANINWDDTGYPTSNNNNNNIYKLKATPELVGIIGVDNKTGTFLNTKTSPMQVESCYQMSAKTGRIDIKKKDGTSSGVVALCPSGDVKSPVFSCHKAGVTGNIPCCGTPKGDSPVGISQDASGNWVCSEIGSWPQGWYCKDGKNRVCEQANIGTLTTDSNSCPARNTTFKDNGYHDKESCEKNCHLPQGSRNACNNQHIGYCDSLSQLSDPSKPFDNDTNPYILFAGQTCECPTSGWMPSNGLKLWSTDPPTFSCNVENCGVWGCGGTQKHYDAHSAKCWNKKNPTGRSNFWEYTACCPDSNGNCGWP